MRSAGCLVGCFLLAGCGGGGEQLLLQQGSADLKCPIESVKTKEPAIWIGHAKGCGREMAYRWDGDGWISPLKRAEFELSCPKDKLELSILEEGTVGISGCGQRVVYVFTQTTSVSRGEWVLNSTSKRD